MFVCVCVCVKLKTVDDGENAFQGIRPQNIARRQPEGEDGSFNLKQVNDKKKYYIFNRTNRNKKYTMYILLGVLWDFDCSTFMALTNTPSL